MSENKLLKEHLSILYKALEVARQGLNILKENPIAQKTLAEIDKITKKVL